MDASAGSKRTCTSISSILTHIKRLLVIASMLNKTTELLKEFSVKKRQDIFRENKLLQLGINYRGASLVSDEQYTDKDEVFKGTQRDMLIRAMISLMTRTSDTPTIFIVRPDGYIGALIGKTFETFAICRHSPALIKDGFLHSWPVTIINRRSYKRWQHVVFHSMSVNVLIVGAGPSGLSLALLLLRNGLSVRIVEKQLQFHPGERGAGIQPRTLELYKLLGILPDIIDRSSPPPTNLRSFAMPDDGKPPNLTPIAQSLVNTPDRPLINARMLGQNRQEQLLREHIFADYGIQVELGTELKSFEQQPDHVVVHVVNIVDSKIVEESFTVDWLVGADGARGVVRKQLGLTFLGESPEMDAVTGDIYVLGDPLDHLDFSIWRQSDQAEPVIVSMRPCAVQGKNLYQFLIGGGKRKLDIDKISSGRKEMVKAFHELTGRRDIEFGELVWMGLWRPNIRMVDRFGEGRVFLVGDAAHVHSPTGGQGMNSSVQDSFNLAWKLALAQKKLAPQSLLNSYSQERLPVIAAMLNKTTELFQKEFVGKVGQKQEFVRGYELRQLGINYRGAPLVSDEKYTDKDEVNDPYRSGDDGTVRAGDRAPDAPCLAQLGVNETSSTVSLFDLLNTTQHSALVFPGSTGRDFADEVSGTLREYPSNLLKSIFILPRTSSASSFTLSDMTLVDTEGHAYSGYDVAHDTPTVFIVRPDGYIGALVTSGRLGIRNYFSNIFL
ncbi:FAD binding domain-containing protein [Lentinula edodes]|nr:FAD binding domain-containing protein [Lentinula edodes]